MAETKDILLNDDNDLLFQGGDLVLGNNDFFYIRCIVESAKGWWKQYPYIGAAIIESINGDISQSKIQDIRLNLESDGFSVKSVKVVDGNLTIEAKK